MSDAPTDFSARLAGREMGVLICRRAWKPDNYKGAASYSLNLPHLPSPINIDGLRGALWKAGITDFHIEPAQVGMKVHIGPEDYRDYLLPEIASIRDR